MTRYNSSNCNKENKNTAAIAAAALCVAISATLAGGCKSTEKWRSQADDAAAKRIAAAQNAVRGSAEEVGIETPGDTLRRRLLLDQNLLTSGSASLGIRDLPKTKLWDGAERLAASTNSTASGIDTTNAVKIALSDAVRIAAANSREYQARKETLFTSALALDLESSKFRSTFSGILDSSVDSSPGDEERSETYKNRLKLGSRKVFENGAEVAGSIAVDLAGMLSGEKNSAWGVIADASINIPLLRGSGKLVTREPLTQAERGLVYEVRRFEQYKRDFMVRVAGSYLGVLISKRTMLNEEENYRRVIISTRRSRRLADASRMSLADFDQSRQSELNARNSWVAACQSYESALEGFKVQIGLPPDARLDLSDTDLDELQDYAAKFAKTELGDYDVGDAKAALILSAPESVDEGELKERVAEAVKTAFEARPDFMIQRDSVEDAQRHVLVAEDSLRAELTIGGSASVGQSISPTSEKDGEFKVSDAKYGGILKLDLPFERTSERNSYRRSLIALEAAVRSYQETEDGIKLAVREAVRELLLKREQLKIQFLAVSLAERRVKNNDLLLQAGRAEMRDVLDAQAALLSAQNSLFSAIRGYRVKEWELQKEIGTLDVSIEGAWRESDLNDLGLWEHP